MNFSLWSERFAAPWDWVFLQALNLFFVRPKCKQLTFGKQDKTKISILSFLIFPAGIYVIKINIGNIRTICEVCSEWIIKTPRRRLRHRSGVFNVNFQQILQTVLVFLLLTLKEWIATGFMVFYLHLKDLNPSISTE